MGKARKVRDMKKVLEGYTSKAWTKRYESEVRAGRLPPAWLTKFGKTIFEAVTKWDVVHDWWNLDIAP